MDEGFLQNSLKIAISSKVYHDQPNPLIEHTKDHLKMSGYQFLPQGQTYKHTHTTSFLHYI